jgi:hypothetical protein
MNQLSEGSRGEIAPQRPTGLDLTLQARAMRYQWFVSAFAWVSAKLGRSGYGLVPRARPARPRQPAPPQGPSAFRATGDLILEHGPPTRVGRHCHASAIDVRSSRISAIPFQP